MSIKVAIVAGTRPEAIKLLPVRDAFAAHPALTPTFIATGQHKQMLETVFKAFGTAPDVAMDVMKENEPLSDLLGRLMHALQKEFQSGGYDAVVVQGDTSTALAAALAGHYNQLPVIHVEAGLRTGDKWAPFPEESHRRMIGAVADLHFAATEQAARALANEGVTLNVHTVGNPVIDALLAMKRRIEQRQSEYSTYFSDLGLEGRRYILVTTHRRENFGRGLHEICKALHSISDAKPDFDIVFSVHLNPAVRDMVFSRLADVQGIRLIEPQPYDRMIYLMMNSSLILSDSGGLQEEAPSLNVPLLVMREKTERPEGIAAGCSRLVGSEEHRIVAEVMHLLTDQSAYKAMQNVPNPYGDGHASGRIADLVAKQIGVENS